jgi:penicillin-insensitive murein endopeptidase
MIGRCSASIIFIALFTAFPLFSAAQVSVCFGSSERGRLENGVKLPSSGKNFSSYGVIPELAGRTYVHSVVRDVIVDAYTSLSELHPGKVYKFAETGLKDGGLFKPHKTHQNGSSVDFIVPVQDAQGRSVNLPTTALNKYGYAIEFDAKGRYKDYRIDYEALAAHLVALNKAAKKHKVTLRRVIFDPKLTPNLYNTAYGEYLKKNIIIPMKNSWVRHDEHYHVDFNLNCKPLP